MNENDRYILGLTGSIGTGKSTTANMFKAAGIPVWDADETVHQLYIGDADVINEIGVLLPGAVSRGYVDRAALKAALRDEPELLPQIEALVHPRVEISRKIFLERYATGLVVLDIPLLYEVGADQTCDGVLVVTISPAEQRTRVLERGKMTEDTFEQILARQLPLEEKARRADFVIETKSMEHAEQEVHKLIAHLTGADTDHA